MNAAGLVLGSAMVLLALSLSPVGPSVLRERLAGPLGGGSSTLYLARGGHGRER